jgi:hypothetical protein
MKKRQRITIDYRKMTNVPEGGNGHDLIDVPEGCALLTSNQLPEILTNLKNKKCEIYGLAGSVVPNYVLKGRVQKSSFDATKMCFSVVITVKNLHDNVNNIKRMIRTVTIHLPVDGLLDKVINMPDDRLCINASNKALAFFQ